MSHYPDRRTVLAGLAAVPALSALGAGQALAEPVQRPFNLRIVMSGHSLTDPIPGPLAIMVRAAGGKESLGMAIEWSTVPGSPIELRWENDYGLIPDAKRDIADFQLLVLTERVPVRSAIQYHHTNELTLEWFKLALKEGDGGRGADTILYASWITINSGPGNEDSYDFDERLIPFRERLDLEMGSWQDVANYVNQNRPEGSPPMRVIPGPKIMAAVYDAIQAGTAPELTAMSDLFRDMIHVNEKGTYLIALAHFAVIYGRDPRTIPAVRGEPGWPSPKLAAWMKELVWDVVSKYPDSGLV
ncbi:hypothetical protein [Tabrizicola sp.]|uniref:hypothetical protein n=1 Tax=Tabrizicola sp. TaxID=2005166 RepID=UPI003F2EE215